LTYRYMIHVFCEECSEPHSTAIVIYRDEEISSTRSVADIYQGRDIPVEIVMVVGNQFHCPRTGKFFLQRDYRQVFLVRMI
jgi:hypothetical protein